MTASQPLVCIFFKLPPRHQSVLRIHEIAWNVFLPQMNRLSQALDAVQATHSSPEVKKIWSAVRRRATGMVDKFERIGITNYNSSFAFLAFLNAVHDGRDGSGPYENFRSCTSQIFDESRKVQDVMLNFREEIRIAVGRIASILSSDDKDVSSFITECSQSLLEFATGVEECSAILEEHREDVKEVQRQSFDQKDNRPSEDEFRMVRDKWKVFYALSDSPAYRWPALWREIQGPEKKNGEPAVASHNATSPIMSTDSSKSQKKLFWRKFFPRISSCFD